MENIFFKKAQILAICLIIVITQIKIYGCLFFLNTYSYPKNYENKKRWYLISTNLSK